MQTRRVTLSSFQKPRCLRSAQAQPLSGPFYEVQVQEGTFPFPVADVEAASSTSAYRVYQGVQRLLAHHDYDEPVLRRFGYDAAWAGTLRHDAELVLSWSEAREDAAFDATVTRGLTEGVMEEAEALVRHVVMNGRAVKLEPLAALTSADRQTLDGMYEAVKLIGRVGRNQALRPQLLAAGVTEETLRKVEALKPRLREAKAQVLKREAEAQWNALPAAVGKAILLRELTEFSQVARAELLPERWALYQVGTLLGRSGGGRPEPAPAPAADLRPTPPAAPPPGRKGRRTSRR